MQHRYSVDVLVIIVVIIIIIDVVLAIITVAVIIVFCCYFIIADFPLINYPYILNLDFLSVLYPLSALINANTSTNTSSLENY